VKIHLDGGPAHGHIVEIPGTQAVAVTMIRGVPRTKAQVTRMQRIFKTWETYRWDLGIERDGMRVFHYS
jgi:hypothetical protein